MDYTGVDIALIGRKSSCKTYFLKAASANDLVDDALEARVWWTSSFAPNRADLIQAPEHGFCPSGNRLLPARLRHLTAADVAETGKERRGAILLVLSADFIFHKGKPRAGGSGIHTAASRTKERLGLQVPFAIAVSVDMDEIGEQQVASTVKTFLTSVKEDLAVEGIPVIAITPRTELWLREQVSEGGRVSYIPGGKQFRIPSAFETMMDRNATAKARAAFDVCDGTGIVAAVSAAVALSPPTLVFPVGDFGTLQSSGWAGEGSPPAQLRTCRLLRASCTPRDVFEVEKKGGIYAGGDVTGAEAVPASADADARAVPATIELDAPIGPGAWAMRLTTSQKAVKVWRVGEVAAGSRAKGDRPLASVQLGDLRSKERRRGRS